MLRELFRYYLPENLIARFPADQRSGSRLLVLDSSSAGNAGHGAIHHRRFSDIVTLVAPGDLMVFNDTWVIPARLLGHKASGGKLELLVERLLDGQRVLAHIRASKSPGPGTVLHFDQGVSATMEQRQDDLFVVRFDREPVLDILERIGHMPLPPYIDRPDRELDRERYQTVYARQPGAVAAPTAGLHFDDKLLAQLRDRGVEFGYVTLHVGAGTFQPVRVDDIREHRMHAEWFEVSEALCRQVEKARAAGKRGIAVGTTSVRCLETAGASGTLRPMRAETDIFIYPGYRFRVVDALVTNFHLPESTLLMLVCAFAGYREVLAAYRAAVAEKYRFFSYGDAMFISRNDAAHALTVGDLSE